MRSGSPCTSTVELSSRSALSKLLIHGETLLAGKGSEEIRGARAAASASSVAKTSVGASLASAGAFVHSDLSQSSVGGSEACEVFLSSVDEGGRVARTMARRSVGGGGWKGNGSNAGGQRGGASPLIRGPFRERRRERR